MNISSRRYSQDLRRYYRLPAVQVSLTLVLSLFVMAIFILFALRPTIVAIVSLRQTITESESTLQKLNTKVTNLQNAANQLEALKPLLPAVNTTIPNDGSRYSQLTKDVESLAIQNGVSIESESMGSTLLFSRVLSPFVPSKNQSVVAMPYSVRVTGSFASVNGFLRGLMSMERVILVDSVTLTRDAGARTTVPIISLNISGNVYYLADQTQLDKAIPPAGR